MKVLGSVDDVCAETSIRGPREIKKEIEKQRLRDPERQTDDGLRADDLEIFEELSGVAAIGHRRVAAFRAEIVELLKVCIPLAVAMR